MSQKKSHVYESESKLFILRLYNPTSQTMCLVRIHEETGFGQGMSGGKLKVMALSPPSYVSPVLILQLIREFFASRRYGSGIQDL